MGDRKNDTRDWFHGLRKERTHPAKSSDPPASPFPPELVERVESTLKNYWNSRGRVDVQATQVISVVAEWLRSDEVRERACIEAQEAADAYTEMDLTGWRKVSDAVLAAALEGKER